MTSSALATFYVNLSGQISIIAGQPIHHMNTHSCLELLPKPSPIEPLLSHNDMVRVALFERVPTAQEHHRTEIAVAREREIFQDVCDLLHVTLSRLLTKETVKWLDLALKRFV